MSTDEIRGHKAMALLEFKEAEESIEQLKKEKALLATEFQSIADLLRSGDIAADDLERRRGITVDAALVLVLKLKDAEKQLAEADIKKRQFGL
jgi:hypothetical protein